MTHVLSRLSTPLADLLAITAPDGTVCALEFADQAERLHRLFARHHPAAALADGPPPAALARAMDAYFSKDFAALGRLAVAITGTAFQRRAWAALRTIPAGQTRSYAQQAASIGQPTATRAIGSANCANPIAIIVPCHRVIGTAGALTGYAGGVERKAWLLAHEGAIPPTNTLPL
jgi:O-6-methylguanine DNA methyltransferase